MSIASTLDQARDFLLLPADLPAAGVLQAARDRRAELQAKSADPKSPAIGRSGAARKLKELEPLLPILEIESELAALEAVADGTSGPHVHRLRLEHKKLTERVGALPAGDERTILSERLEAVQEELKPGKGGTLSPGPDPAQAAFDGKRAELHAALERNEKNKSRLTGLLDAARALASVLRDEAARAAAIVTLDEIAGRVEQALAALPKTTPPFDPTPRMLAAKISALRAALEQKNRSRVPFLLESARELAAGLDNDAARAAAETELEKLAAAVDELLAAPEPAEKTCSENIASLRDALDRRDLPRATATLAEARAAAAGIREAGPRVRFESEIGSLAVRFEQIAGEIRAEAQRKAAAATPAPVAPPPIPLPPILPPPPRRDEATPSPFPPSQPSPRRGDATPTPFPPSKPSPRREDATPSPFAPSKPPTESVAPHSVAPPPQSNRRPEAGRVLKLIPQTSLLVTGVVPAPLHFVTLPEFVIGRFSEKGASRANYSCPLTEKRVSRTHVTLSRRGEDIMICDGDGKAKSSNGSRLDDEVLTLTPVPASFERERTISLGGVFSLTAQHFAGEAPSGPTAAADASSADGGTMIIALVSGSMRFASKGDGQQPAQVVWLFTDASFGTSPANAVPLPNSSLADKHGRIHFWQDGFWVENLRSGSALTIAETGPADLDHTMVIRARPLAKGELVALRNGDTLRLGQIEYSVTIEP